MMWSLTNKGQSFILSESSVSWGARTNTCIMCMVICLSLKRRPWHPDGSTDLVLDGTVLGLLCRCLIAWNNYKTFLKGNFHRAYSAGTTMCTLVAPSTSTWVDFSSKPPPLVVPRMKAFLKGILAVHLWEGRSQGTVWLHYCCQRGSPVRGGGQRVRCPADCFPAWSLVEEIHPEWYFLFICKHTVLKCFGLDIIFEDKAFQLHWSIVTKCLYKLAGGNRVALLVSTSNNSYAQSFLILFFHVARQPCWRTWGNHKRRSLSPSSQIHRRCFPSSTPGLSSDWIPSASSGWAWKWIVTTLIRLTRQTRLRERLKIQLSWGLWWSGSWSRAPGRSCWRHAWSAGGTGSRSQCLLSSTPGARPPWSDRRWWPPD